ncbi:NAD-dependent epimerase/dehydratase family protein [candidate division GN15 bacterium]|nr:NAD-dependent epimerase/dehydratase family protein [candidate division GN15 bacterium]
MPDSILVTGGAGFIGSHLVDRLLADGHRVTVIDNFNDFYDPAIKRANCRPHREQATYRLVEGDIRNREDVAACFEGEAITEVIHLAAMAGVRPSIKNPVLYQEVNLVGTMNILEACRTHGVGRYIFASSSSVYGNNRKVPFSEDDFVDHPISPYAATKKSGELMAYTYHHLYGFKTACLRFFTVYGPRQRPEMAIHLFTDRIWRGEEIAMFGEGDSRRDYTFIEDIVEGVLACRSAEYDFAVLNLGRSDTVRLHELITKIEQNLGKKAIIKTMPQQPGDVDQTFADISKARSLLGFEPKVSIDDGLARFVAWYLKKQEQQ